MEPVVDLLSAPVAPVVAYEGPAPEDRQYVVLRGIAWAEEMKRLRSQASPFEGFSNLERRPDDDSSVELSLDDAFVEIAGTARHEEHLELGHFASDPRQRIGEHAGHRRRDRSQPEFAHQFVAARQAAHPPDLDDHPLAALDDGKPGLGRHHAASGPRQQGNADLPFKNIHALGDGRRREVQMPRRSGERAVLQDGEEGLRQSRIHHFLYLLNQPIQQYY